MGDIKRIRKKYETPTHPWNRERIDQEKIYIRRYGLRNKKEIWKAATILKQIKSQIKEFPSLPVERAAVLESQLRGRLQRMGLIKEDTPLGDVLGYETESILDRRLQTIIHKKGLARTPKQARQMITHEHVLVNGRTISAPGYLVLKDEESAVEFRTRSGFISEDHPERVVEKPQAPPKKKRSGDDQEEVELVQLSEEDEE